MKGAFVLFFIQETLQKQRASGDFWQIYSTKMDKLSILKAF